MDNNADAKGMEILPQMKALYVKLEQ